MNTTTHTPEQCALIAQLLKDEGVLDYRFCVENDCYVCDRNGSFFSVCTRQLSKAGNLIEKYSVKRLSGSVDRYGYTTYRVTVDGVKKHLKAHRMMLNAWVGIHPELAVNHIDGDKHNNALTNLEWCTVAENNAHAIRTGLLDPHKAWRFGHAIPTSEWMTIYILNKHFGVSYSELGRRYHCTHSTITAITERIGKVMKEVGCA